MTDPLRTVCGRLVCGLLLLVAVLPRISGGQDRPPQFPPRIASPEVHPDRSISFQIWAPSAQVVALLSSDLPNANPFAGLVSLQRTEEGSALWTAKVGPYPGGTYRYVFNVDGVAVVDPTNPRTSESNGQSWSLVTVPGSDVSDLRDVPHGSVATWTYHSKSLDRPRRAHVYTPPGYERSTASYPVLYLLHGATDSDASWSSVGRAGLVLDNLIAAGKAKPMIVVMPMGHTGPFRFGPGNDFQQQMTDFQRDFIEDLKPQVEQKYRINAQRSQRALAGLSMGGAQTINLLIDHGREFGHIGVFSSGVFGITGNGFGAVPNAPPWAERNANALRDPALKQGLQTFWFATGKNDFLLETTRETVKAFKAHDFTVTYDETEGDHSWSVWREVYLPKFAALLFNDMP